VKFLFVLVQLGAAVIHEDGLRKMNFANCVVLSAVLFPTLIESLRLCSSAEAEIVLKF